MPGGSWRERGQVEMDYDVHYHSAGDTGEHDGQGREHGLVRRVRLPVLAGSTSPPRSAERERSVPGRGGRREGEHEGDGAPDDTYHRDWITSPSKSPTSATRVSRKRTNA